MNKANFFLRPKKREKFIPSLPHQKNKTKNPSHIHLTASFIIHVIGTDNFVPVTSLIPAVWFTEPPVSGNTQVYSPVGDV